MLALLLDEAFQRHRTHRGHPESPARIDAIQRAVQDALPAEKILRIAPRPATREELFRCHHPEYVEEVLTQIGSGLRDLAGGDVSVSPESGEVALLASGGVLNAIDRIFAGDAVRRGFCAVRPPGHHATPDRAMGFCLFNHIALAARHAQACHGIQRVAIVDWDVHHGNGTQEIFYGDPSVFFFSAHQFPWYPGTGLRSETGIGAARDTTMNRPLPAGTGGATLLEIFHRDLLPALGKFRPELLLISAGFDSRKGDPLGELQLSDSDYAEMTKLLLEFADKFCDGRVLSLLEGGYSLEGLQSAATAHLRVLGDSDST